MQVDSERGAGSLGLEAEAVIKEAVAVVVNEDLHSVSISVDMTAG